MNGSTIHREWTVRSEDLSLFVQFRTPNHTPRAAIVIVHGYSDHSGRYRHLVDRLVTEGYAVFALDLPGHGRSPGKRGHVESWKTFRNSLHSTILRVQTEHPNTHVFVYGHSMGGLIALDYAAHVPDDIQGLIISSPAVAIPPLPSLVVKAVELIGCIMPTLSIRAHIGTNRISRDDVEVSLYENDPLVHGRVTPRLLIEAKKTILELTTRKSRIGVPSLWIHGGSDKLTPPNGIRNAFDILGSDDSTRREYPDALHELHNDLIRTKVFDDIVTWLRQHT